MYFKTTLDAATDPPVVSAPSAEETPASWETKELAAVPAAALVKGTEPLYDARPVPRGTEDVVAAPAALYVYDAKIAELADSASVTGQMV